MITKTYTQATTAWEPFVNRFEGSVVEEVNVSVWDDVREQGGEMIVTWHDLGPYIAPKIEAFLDGFLALEYVTLALRPYRQDAGTNDPELTPAQFLIELDALGFVPSEYHNRLEKKS